jgi:hypothetical protein
MAPQPQPQAGQQPAQGQPAPATPRANKFSELPVLSQLMAMVIVGGVFTLCLGGGYKLVTTLIEESRPTATAQPSWAGPRELLLSASPTVIPWPAGVTSTKVGFRCQISNREDWHRGYIVECGGFRTLLKGSEKKRIEFVAGQDFKLTSEDGEPLRVTAEFFPK